MQEDGDAAERWEYWTCFFTANAETEREFLKHVYGRRDPPKHAPEALVPKLNAVGEKGWELVHMQPVVAGRKLDIEMFGHEEGMFAEWTSTYFCVFKRRLRGI